MSPESYSAALAAELRIAVGQIIRRLRAEHAFSLPQGAVLGALDRHGPQSISDLASGAHMRPQSMAQTVHELEQRGLVERRPDPDDRRRAFVELTTAGREALAADRARREGWLTRALETELSESERALLEQAVPLLRRVADA
ncbi:MarR family winged helix-turn-helix transcriptional regulator [Candidatus Solirubrobacter pratensis]|uniref:MarR family winged helix-turn-helix transcriptional regulator n=1 Tax=Candidatus Solirubrobacter pratensis TaxID=1298857 RepID=UPI000427572C|nr:MarR family transcriptional regulator [Candidatus Solirubrobacter pratensis]